MNLKLKCIFEKALSTVNTQQYLIRTHSKFVSFPSNVVRVCCHKRQRVVQNSYKLLTVSLNLPLKRSCFHHIGKIRRIIMSIHFEAPNKKAKPSLYAAENCMQNIWIDKFQNTFCWVGNDERLQLSIIFSTRAYACIICFSLVHFYRHISSLRCAREHFSFIMRVKLLRLQFLWMRWFCGKIYLFGEKRASNINMLPHAIDFHRPTYFHDEKKIDLKCQNARNRLSFRMFGMPSKSSCQ